MLAIALMASPDLYANNGGGKKKARKKAKTERKAQNCDPKQCDPKNCDPKNCDPKCYDLSACVKDEKCPKSSCGTN